MLGVGVVSATEVNFAWAGFVTAMISNFSFVFRNIWSKQAQKDIGLKGINLYAWMSIIGTVLLLPVTLYLEGDQIATACATPPPTPPPNTRTTHAHTPPCRSPARGGSAAR